LSNLDERTSVQEAIKVLVVEDDPLFTKLVASMLLTKSKSVNTASSAEEAIELLKLQRFDVLITDLQMKGLGGIGLIRWVMAESACHISRMLVITGEPANSQDSAWVRSQNVPILEKPFGLKSLLQAVESIVQAHT
jgi:two-component system, response regulator FlrC